MKKIKEQEPMIARADEKYRSFLSDEDAFYASLEHERWVRDRAQMILDGEERGRAAGLEQGRAEERTETAAKMIELGVDEDIVLKATGLSREQLSELIARLE